MPNIAEEGTFRGHVIEMGLKEAGADSQSLAVSFKVVIDEWWLTDHHQWDDMRPDPDVEEDQEQYFVYGDMWIVKKDGSLREDKVREFEEIFGCKLDLKAIHAGKLEVQDFQFTVKENAYNGNVYYRIDWFRKYDESPVKSVGNVDDDQVAGLTASLQKKINAAGSGKMMRKKASKHKAPKKVAKKVNKAMANSPKAETRVVSNEPEDAPEDEFEINPGDENDSSLEIPFDDEDEGSYE